MLGHYTTDPSVNAGAPHEVSKPEMLVSTLGTRRRLVATLRVRDLGAR